MIICIPCGATVDLPEDLLTDPRILSGELKCIHKCKSCQKYVVYNITLHIFEDKVPLGLIPILNDITAIKDELKQHIHRIIKSSEN